MADEVGERLDPFDAPETLDETTLYSAFGEREVSQDEEDEAFWESLTVKETGEDASTTTFEENSGANEIGETGEADEVGETKGISEVGEVEETGEVGENGEVEGLGKVGENSEIGENSGIGEINEVGEAAEGASSDGGGEEDKKARSLGRPSSARLVVEGVLTDATLGSGRVDCVLCPSATPFAIGRRERVERILAKISRRARNLVVYSTPVGVEAGAAIFDGGSALALDGDVRTSTRFPFVAATFAVNRVDLTKKLQISTSKTKSVAEKSKTAQVATSSEAAKAENSEEAASATDAANFAEIIEIARMMQDAEIAQTLKFDALDLFELAQLAEINADAEAALAEGDVLTLTSEVCVDWGDEALCELEEGLEGWELDADAPFEEFARATALGLFDYMRKSRSRGFALSLSGGADSATIAALIRFGVKLGRRQLGTRLFLRWLTRYFSATGSLNAFPALASLDAELGEAADAFENGDGSRLAVFLSHSDDAFEPALHSALESALHSAVDEALSAPLDPAREIYFGDCIDCGTSAPDNFDEYSELNGGDGAEEGDQKDATEDQKDATEEEAFLKDATEENVVASRLFAEDGEKSEILPASEALANANENDVENETSALITEKDAEIDGEELNAIFETVLSGAAPSTIAGDLFVALEDALERRIVEPLLTTVYQATRNSGDVTRTAAREVAEFCGATHLEFDVDGIVEAYKTLVADATGAPFNWATDDLALQNIQARSRGPSVWLLANRSGRLLLSTGNRSEVACGYATMDGDTCGGLSPISGIDKAFVRKWLIWAEKTGLLLDFDDQGNEIRFKAPALSFINDQQPTAELRPVEAKQTDEADLMPYTVLNLFERALIRDRLDLDAAIARVRTEAAEAGIVVDGETLSGWAVRFCRLWARTQWKRQRYAPGFPIDDYDLSPNSWTRYPILSEGFEREIADLQGRQ